MSEERLEVVMLPDYTDVNPYQRQLADGFDADDVSVTVTGPGDTLLPLTRAVRDCGLPDVVHLHFLSQFILASEDLPSRLIPPVSVLLGVRFLFEVTLLRLFGVSVVWTAHDVTDHQQLAPRVERAVRSVFVRALTDEVIVHCESAVDAVIDAYRLPDRTRGRTTVVPHGNFGDVYLDETDRTSAREALNLPADAFVYVFFGSVKRYKNVTGLIRSFRSLDAEDARLVVAGAPDNEDIATELTELAAPDDRIRTRLERVPDEVVPTYLRAADVVTLPFRTTCPTLLTSGSLVLAMRQGRPVVTSTLGCNPDMLTDRTPPEDLSFDPAAARADARVSDGGTVERGPTAVSGGVLYDRDHNLAAALRLARRVDLSTMGERNRAHTRGLEWTHIAERTAVVYRSALATE